jgi:RES domain-containing protein
VVYTAGSRALAQLEKRVHCNGIEPPNMALLRLDLADSATLPSAADDFGLRNDWRDDEAHTQALGNAWLRAKHSLGLWVPSYVEKREQNLLLNPDHPQYATHISVVIEDRDFHFDPRMF